MPEHRKWQMDKHMGGTELVTLQLVTTEKAFFFVLLCFYNYLSFKGIIYLVITSQNIIYYAHLFIPLVPSMNLYGANWLLNTLYFNFIYFYSFTPYLDVSESISCFQLLVDPVAAQILVLSSCFTWMDLLDKDVFFL